MTKKKELKDDNKIFFFGFEGFSLINKGSRELASKIFSLLF